MSKDVEKFIQQCHACQVTAPASIKCQPLQMTEIPKTPWETLAMDLKGPFPSGEHLLVVIDYRSRYPVIATLNNINSFEIISRLKEIFSIFGLPKCITVDNGTQFNSEEFKSFLKEHQIEHRRVTPYWPSANGEVERFNRTLGKAVQTAHAEGICCNKKNSPIFTTLSYNSV